MAVAPPGTGGCQHYSRQSNYYIFLPYAGSAKHQPVPCIRIRRWPDAAARDAEYQHAVVTGRLEDQAFARSRADGNVGEKPETVETSGLLQVSLGRVSCSRPGARWSCSQSTKVAVQDRRYRPYRDYLEESRRPSMTPTMSGSSRCRQFR
ncbi:hypothetical protein BDW72DRAFT_175421 [Aspergillus terricola var. indicus]